jgi:uncharacterized LabA/DUF88 family protein
MYADQRSFVGKLQSTDSRISIHFGRIEPRPAETDAAGELQRYLHAMTVRIDSGVFRDLVAIASKYKNIAWVEKAVDVQIAIDMVVMAARDEYDAAYLLSADGDFTGAVEFVRGWEEGLRCVLVTVRSSRKQQIRSSVSPPLGSTIVTSDDLKLRPAPPARLSNPGILARKRP